MNGILGKFAIYGITDLRFPNMPNTLKSEI